MKDKTGLLMVGAAAAVLYMVVKKSTGAAPSGKPGAVGNGAASFWSNMISNLGGSPVMTTGANSVALPQIGGVTLFGNGTFDAGGIYTDPGQVTVNSSTGQVQESPFSGMYGVLAPATYGF